MADKIALITGGATGIGKATALILARGGVKVVITGRRAPRPGPCGHGSFRHLQGGRGHGALI